MFLSSVLFLYPLLVVCGKCSVFHDSKSTPPVDRKSPLMTKENMEFYMKMKGKKK